MQKDRALEYRRVLLEIHQAFCKEESEIISHLLEVTILAIEEEYPPAANNGSDSPWPLRSGQVIELN